MKGSRVIISISEVIHILPWNAISYSELAFLIVPLGVTAELVCNCAHSIHNVRRGGWEASCKDKELIV